MPWPRSCNATKENSPTLAANTLRPKSPTELQTAAWTSRSPSMPMCTPSSSPNRSHQPTTALAIAPALMSLVNTQSRCRLAPSGRTVIAVPILDNISKLERAARPNWSTGIVLVFHAPSVQINERGFNQRRETTWGRVQLDRPAVSKPDNNETTEPQHDRKRLKLNTGARWWHMARRQADPSPDWRPPL